MLSRLDMTFIVLPLVVTLALAAPSAPASAHGPDADDERVIVIGDDDLLQRLIDLDQAGIDEMRADIAEARAEIEEAIADIKEARDEAKSVPGGRLIVKIAFTASSKATSEAVTEALGEARREINEAERELETADVSAEERAETQGAIDALRTDLDALEKSLKQLIAELKA